MSTKNKGLFDSFAGIATKYNEVKGTSQAIISGAADIYVSSYGNHTVKLDRYVRNEAVLCIDPEYIGVAYLRPFEKTELAKTGDGTKWMMTVEYGNVVQNRSAHAVIGGCGV
jgi:hypothetical protein